MLLTGGRSAAAPSNLWLARRGSGGGGRNWRPWEASPPPGPAEALCQPSRTSSGSSSCDSPPRPAQPGPAIDNCQHGGRGIVGGRARAPGHLATRRGSCVVPPTPPPTAGLDASPPAPSSWRFTNLYCRPKLKGTGRGKAGRGRAAEAKGEQRPSIVIDNYSGKAKSRRSGGWVVSSGVTLGRLSFGMTSNPKKPCGLSETPCPFFSCSSVSFPRQRSLC